MKGTKLNHLMIIDDDPDSIFLHKNIINKDGSIKRISDFQSAMEALNFLKFNLNTPDLLPDAILLDIRMPGMNGFEFLNQFEKFPKDTKEKTRIFLLTSSDYVGDYRKYILNLSIKNYFIKPLKKEHIEIIKNYF